MRATHAPPVLAAGMLALAVATAGRSLSTASSSEPDPAAWPCATDGAFSPTSSAAFSPPTSPLLDGFSGSGGGAGGGMVGPGSSSAGRPVLRAPSAQARGGSEELPFPCSLDSAGSELAVSPLGPVPPLGNPLASPPRTPPSAARAAADAEGALQQQVGQLTLGPAPQRP